jgi:FLYWCH zinc finger domain
MSQIQKLLSEKGKPMVLHVGYIYTLERTATEKLIFRCQNRNCKGKGTLYNHNLIELNIFQI